MSMIVSLWFCIMSRCTHLKISWYMSFCAFVCSCGMYAVIAMMGVPSCGVIMAALI
jgi:hypothetical protein